MGREVRRVPANWEHPLDVEGEFVPLRSGDLAKLQANWDVQAAKWAEGLRDDFSGGWMPLEEEYRGKPYDVWDGERPRGEEFMPQWPVDKRTHYQMYETTTEGTPISPVFSNPEELAHWLADTGASAFASMTATYDEWLATINDGPATTAMATVNGDGTMSLISGVAANAARTEETN